MLPGLQPNSRLLAAVLCAAFVASSGCDRQPQSSGELVERRTDAVPAPPAPRLDAGLHGPTQPSTLDPAADPLPADAGAGPATWQGPVFTVTSSSAGIYAQPASDRSLKIGYARSGGKIPVAAEKVSGPGCKAGWYAGVEGGYICSTEGTLDSEDPRARLAGQQPDLAAVLPYPYARNVQNGTPLYASVPTEDQMEAYEPYLAATAPARADSAARSRDVEKRPWWQQADIPLSQVRLAHLATESDGIIARRMVKGFYIAVDKEFEWSSRAWYKTTKGLVAPKDRFVPVEGSPFRGVELDGERSLPVAWVYGPSADRPKYELGSTGKFKQVGVIERLQPIYLTGERQTMDGHSYALGRDGFWVRADQVRIAELPSIPASVASDERWIFVHLPSQTLVAMVGATPAYATLVSSGRESEDEAQDHRTPPGEWTIREKHVTTTMDGDGTAAGDLPYSIEDVPYVMYFEGSYALHGAFWHRNYGVRKSHGCVNLAPLDAKYLFAFTGPTVRTGWHGAWAGNGQTGSRIVISGPRRGAPAAR